MLLNANKQGAGFRRNPLHRLGCASYLPGCLPVYAESDRSVPRYDGQRYELLLLSPQPRDSQNAYIPTTRCEFLLRTMLDPMTFVNFRNLTHPASRAETQ